MRRGRGMSLQTMAKRAGIFAGTDTGPHLPDYKADPKVGDIVEWIHSVKNQNRWMQGRVIRLLEPKEDHNKHRGTIAKRRWRVSKNYVGCKRVIVEVENVALPDFPLYYTVTYLRLAKNAFRVVKTEGEASAS